VRLPVRAPAHAGRYTLGWDIVQEGRLWFSTEPGARLAQTSVTVGAADPSMTPWAGQDWASLPPQASRIGRLTLWRAALRLIAAHPVLGLGPDNFRLSYGAMLPGRRADDRVTSNNMYLEIATGTGVAGLAVFGWFAFVLAKTVLTAPGRLDAAAASLYAGVAAALLAIAVHGLVDSFLTLTPTYLMMALVVGMATAPDGWGTGGNAAVDARRI
jgi:O-antigen ligase